MKVLSAIVLGVSLSAVAAGQLLSEKKPPPEGSADAAPALGIALEGWPYPFPVRFLPLAIDRQDVRMAYMDVPPSAAPNGRCALLLHGKNFSGEYWAATARALAGAGFRVVIPDQVGFGKSTIAEIRYSFDRLAENTAKLLDSLSVSRCVVVGHSMGGMLAVRFARNFPERTERLVLENPIGLEDYRFQIPPQPLEKLYARELANTDAGKIREFFGRYFVVWKPEYERFVEIRSRVGASGDYPRYAMASALTYEMIYQQPVRHEFPLLAVPTLLVIGQADRTTIGRGTVPEAALQGLGDYPALGKAAARDIRGSRLVEIPWVGHIPHLEAPDRFHAALLDFLAARP